VITYLLDANIFIQAKNLHYGMDFCPAFWDWLVQQNQMGKVFSIEKVGDELEAGGDDLSIWAAKIGPGFFHSPDETVLTALGQVSQWVTSQQYSPAAVSTFFQVADFYLVAHALGHQYVIVTHEVPSDGARKVKIPNVCIGMKIKCMSPYEMLRRERARFVLGQQTGNV
jgi:hypothetical protein